MMLNYKMGNSLKKQQQHALAGVAQLGEHHPMHLKVASSILGPRRIPRVWVQSLVRVHARHSQSMFLSLSPTTFSL